MLCNFSTVDRKRREDPVQLHSMELPSQVENPVIKLSPDGRVVALGLGLSIYVFSASDGIELMECLNHIHQGKRVY